MSLFTQKPFQFFKSCIRPRQTKMRKFNKQVRRLLPRKTRSSSSGGISALGQAETVVSVCKQFDARVSFGRAAVPGADERNRPSRQTKQKESAAVDRPPGGALRMLAEIASFARQTIRRRSKAIVRKLTRDLRNSQHDRENVERREPRKCEDSSSSSESQHP